MGNFLRHSFAHFGSSQVEAIATILSFHLHSATKLNKIKEHIRFCASLLWVRVQLMQDISDIAKQVNLCSSFVA